jgi:REP element-mobilizing transposase RayT
VPHTRERWRSRLPHWEVAGHPHFITIRCAGSLPTAALARVREIHSDLCRLSPTSAQFSLLQHQYFLTCEKYLDRSECFAPFRLAAACESVLAAWSDLSRAGWDVPHGVMMPNHLHFLITPTLPDPAPLRLSVRQFKGRVARQANLSLGRTGPFWQPDWFDRWMRDSAEEARVVDYIRNNPVRAGLANDWREYRWLQTTTP